MICPQCGSADTRASRNFRLGDIFERLRGKGTFRCRRCSKRFYASEPYASGLKKAVQSIRNQQSSHRLRSRTWKRLVRNLIMISIFALAFVLFLLCMRYVIAQASPVQGAPGALEMIYGTLRFR
jgi:hypothetical protein